MKRILTMAAFAFIIVLGSSWRNTASAQSYDDDDYTDDRDREVNYQTFYDELSPHGRWVDNDDYGYVWVPNAGNDFRPYSTNGHWVWTDNYEWMWVSDYDWGWAPFHYGRWEEDPSYGWFWVPGYEWSPAWVAWRDGGDYYGWAPIRPGINISVNFNIGGYAPPDNYWCFAPRRYITSPRIFDYCIDRRRNTSIIYQTVIINNFNYGNNYGFRSGPRRYDAERYCGRINPVRFRESYNPGRTFYRNNEVSMYRPNVNRNNDRSFAPRQVQRYDRGSGQFRTSDRNNGRINNNGNRGNDNGFRRPEEGRREVANNNRPDRRDRANDGPFRRNDDNVRQPQNNNGNRRMERTDNGNRQPGNDQPVYRPQERREQPDGRNNRSFERRPDNGGSNGAPVREPRVRTENPDRQPQRQPAQQMERRQEQRPPQTERRQEQRPPQMERRQEPRPQQQPTRQFERRSNEVGSRPSAERNDSRGGNENRGGGNNNGGGRGRRF